MKELTEQLQFAIDTGAAGGFGRAIAEGAASVALDTSRAGIATRLAAALLSVREVNAWTDEDVARRACGVADALIRQGFMP